MKIRIHIFFIVLLLISFKGAFLQYIPALRSYDTYSLLITDLIITALGLSTIAKVPGSLLFGLFALLGVSTINFFISSGNNILMHLNGLREVTNIYFVFIFFYNVFDSGYQYYFNRLFKKFAVIFLFSQVPFSIKQFIDFGATDDVAGTLGWGNSGILTLSIFVLVYYLMENAKSSGSNFSEIRYLLSRCFFFIPVFLNETKITFILIPILFMTLVNVSSFKSLILTAIGAGIFLILFSKLFSGYGTTYPMNNNPIKEIYNEDYLEGYLLGDQFGREIDVPRFTKLLIASRVLTRDRHSLIFGKEYGAFKGGSTLNLTQFATKYSWLLKGSRPFLFYTLITGGLTLLVLILLPFFAVLRDRPYDDYKNFSNRLLVFLSFIFLLMLFYNDAFRNSQFVLIFVYLFYYGKYFFAQRVYYRLQ